MIKTALQKSNLFKDTLNYWVKYLKIWSDLVKNSLDLWFDMKCFLIFYDLLSLYSFHDNGVIGKKSNKISPQCAISIKLSYICVCV